MKLFTVQYSTPGNKVAVSDWQERSKTIKADSAGEAVKRFEKNRDGTWMILDCWGVT